MQSFPSQYCQAVVVSGDGKDRGDGLRLLTGTQLPPSPPPPFPNMDPDPFSSEEGLIRKGHTSLTGDLQILQMGFFVVVIITVADVFK